MKITAVLPVSRTSFLDKVFDSLLNQTYKPDNLLIIYDGNENEYMTVRNKMVELKLTNVLCVLSNNDYPAASIPDRRNHVAGIHNQAKQLIADADYIFSIEDDGVLPPDALERLVNDVKTQKNVGMVSGFELGRWGVAYVGAWRVNDVNDVKEISSLESHAGEDLIEEIDGCGLYCALIRADYYKQHNFFTNNGLGPDVNLGIWLRQQGLINYVDWNIPVTHLTIKNGEYIEIPATDQANNVTMRLSGQSTWRY